MKPNEHQGDLPQSVAGKLRAIRRRTLWLTFLQGLVRTGAVFLAAMLGAMALDWAFGWFEPAARYTVTILALVLTGTAFVLWCLRPLFQRRTIVATAREVDATLPQLEERWSTVTELSQSTDAPEIRGSEAMIHQVASEAEQAGTNIVPERVVSAQPVWRASRWLLGAAAVLVLFAAVSFTQTSRLVQRFLMPGRAISLTQVSASPGNVWVPKGESLTLNASIQGRVPKNGVTLFVRPEKSAAKIIAMKAGAENRAGLSSVPRHEQSGADAAPFQHAIQEVSESFEYRVRAGDGQTPWQKITAVDRPTISAVKLAVTPPAYSKQPREEKTSLPNAVRLLQGSELEVSFQSDQPLDRMLLDFGNGQSAQLKAGADNWYHYRARPTNSFTFAAAAINQFKLENRSKPSCRISVYEDLPPSVKILEPSDDLAVLPGEKVEVVFEAHDDFGVAKAEVIVNTTTADGEKSTVIIPVDLKADAGKKEFRQTVQLDPRAFGLKHGDQLSYVVQVTDTKESTAEGRTEPNAASSSKPEDSRTGETAQAGSADEQKATEQDALARNDSSDEPKAASDAEESKTQDQNQNGQQQGRSSPSLAAKSGKQNESNPPQNQGAQRPPNDMAMRTLDAGQTSECKPRNIQVDEWAGSFEGERRAKLEMAIEPVLKQLDAWLASAQEKSESLKQRVGSPGLQSADAGRLQAAQEDLTRSTQAIADLKTKSAGTPYAFIGLQLHNIGGAHITPAHRALTTVSITNSDATNQLARLQSGLFHIVRAREMLAALTETYETVKRDQKVGDAMQKLNKMYQIFLEDTQALLKSPQSPINSYDRKLAEVDEQFVEKLKELLEERKKIMAELAQLLAEDPRLLRRYMAMMELQGTTYRDQMTLLSERQKEIQQQVAKWNATTEDERATLLQDLKQQHASGQKQVARDTAKMRENMETWLPLDVKVEETQVQAALKRAEKIVEHAARAVATNESESAAVALDELRALREQLPQLAQVSSTNKAKMTAYIANRMQEAEALITAQSGQMKIVESLESGDFPKVVEIVQHRLTQDTVALGEKLEATEKQVAPLSEEIAKKAALLNRMVQGDIVWPQRSSIDQLAAREMKPAQELLDGLPPAFALAEGTFDELMQLIIAKLDEAPPPGSPGQAAGLEKILAMLEDEMKAAESLGIPCRPMNVSLMQDWMRPGQSRGQGQGMGRAQAQAAQAQAQQAENETKRLAREARGSAQKALAEARKQQGGGAEAVAGGSTAGKSEAWNKLASRLQKDLLQGRDNTPPEQYRAAIENYFKVISETVPAAEK